MSSSGDSKAAKGGDGPLGPILIVFGLLAMAIGVMLYVQSRQSSMSDEADDVVVAMENLDRAKTGRLPLLPMPERSPNTLALVGGLVGGGTLVLIGVLVLSSERRHRETLEAIERRDAAA